MPEKVAGWIKEGFLRFVSVELLKDVKASTREIPWVLDAVALLGADQPAVGILKSLSLTMARSSGLQGRARVAFTRDHSTGVNANMADETKDVSALMARLDAVEKERDALKLKAAEVESFQRKLTDLETTTRNEKIAAHRTKILELFESAIKDKKVLPAARERFKRVYKFDADTILDVPLTDVSTFISENPNPDAPRGGPTSLAAGGDQAPVDALADTQALCAARKFTRENAAEFANMPRWEQLVKAGTAVFRANPELAKSYARLPETLASRTE